MNDELDILLKKAYEPSFMPAKEVNEMIIKNAENAYTQRKHRILLEVAKVAAIIIGIMCIGTAGVYAANYVYQKVFVTDHAISVGNTEYIDDDAIAAPLESVSVEEILHEDGDESVNWISKDVEEVGGYATNTYYQYKDYTTAVADSNLDSWLTNNYENQGNVNYVISETDDCTEYSIEADFSYKDGNFRLAEMIMTGNVAEDAAHSIYLENTNNQRNYQGANGYEYTLVDQITEEQDGTRVVTFVMISYNKYYGYLSFENLSEEDIYEILDQVIIG